MKRLAIAAALALSAAAVRADDAATLFQAKCKLCHGADGKGTPVGKKMGAPDLTTDKITAADAAKVIENGKGKMMPFKGKLSDAEIKALSAYVASGMK
jgi:cytochrome c6